MTLAQRYLLLLIAIALGGTGLSAVSFYDVWRSEQSANREAFANLAELRLSQIQQEIDATLEAVETLATFFEASTEVRPAEFRLFAEGLFDRLPTVRALQWMDYVPAPERAAYEAQLRAAGLGEWIWEPGADGRVAARPRPAYYPVRMIAPASDSGVVVGFDVGFEERRHQTLVAAARSGKMAATPPVSLVIGERRLPAVLVVRPVYGSGRDVRLTGYTASAMVVADLAQRVRGKSAAKEVDFSIHARLEDGSVEALYDGIGGEPRHGAPAQAGTVQIAGETWDVMLAPAPGYFAARIGTTAWLVLLGGLAATVFLFVYVRALYHGTLRAQQNAAALRLRDRAIEASTNAILIVRADQALPVVEYANEAFERITGYSREEVIGRDWRILQGGPEAWDTQQDVESMLRAGDEGALLLRSYRKDGSPFWNALHVAPVRDDESRATHVVAVIEDVTETKSYQEQLEHQATHDVLTGLPNRALLLDRIEQSIARARRNQTLMALVFVDLDHFKRINDGYGHATGDEVLRSVGARLASSLRGGDTVARYAGDEFVIVLNDQPDEAAVEEFCRRISRAVSQPVRVEEREILLSASIGVSLFPRDGNDAETLLQHADTAMYRVKNEGRGATRFFTVEIASDMHLRLTLEQSLRRAIERAEFLLEYQPRVRLADGAPVGVEALVRWERPGYGRVAPAHFINIAEDSGLIVPIGEWVLEAACRQALAWDGALAGFGVSVNLSPRQFRQRDLVDLIDRVLSRTGLDPKRLELEVTESTMMHDVKQAAKTLRRLSGLGVRLALDDFGTGYSSLAYLKTFPIDDLKIDRSFVRDVVQDQEDAQISRAIIGLARNLGLRVVAEGVETADQLRFLCDHGCDEGQGYLFARPLPADQLIVWARDWTPAGFDFHGGDRARVLPLRR